MATFDDVYRRHLPTVLRAAARAVGRRDVAEEITAEAFLELYREFDRIDTDLLPGWLLTVMRHRAVDYWRRQQVERRYLQCGLQMPALTESASSAQYLFTHQSLKPVHRACLVLRYVHELSREEIGQRLGLSATQVRGHLQYGLTLLRKHLVALNPQPRGQDLLAQPLEQVRARLRLVPFAGHLCCRIRRSPPSERAGR